MNGRNTDTLGHFNKVAQQLRNKFLIASLCTSMFAMFSCSPSSNNEKLQEEVDLMKQKIELMEKMKELEQGTKEPIKKEQIKKEPTTGVSTDDLNAEINRQAEVDKYIEDGRALLDIKVGDDTISTEEKINLLNAEINR